MNFLKNYNNKIIKNDFINKFKIKNNRTLPKLKKITLNLGCANFQIQKFAIAFLILEIFSLKKGGITTAKNPNMSLKIQKGHPAGCKITLKKKEIRTFLAKLHVEILPKLKDFSGLKIKTLSSSFSFNISSNSITLQELENLHPLIIKLPNINIHMSTNSKELKKNLFLIRSIKLPT